VEQGFFSTGLKILSLVVALRPKKINLKRKLVYIVNLDLLNSDQNKKRFLSARKF